MHSPGETIVALATPPGRGGVALLRLSGPEALALSRRIFRLRSNGLIDPARAALGEIVSLSTGRPIDTGYLIWHPAGRSYTGDEVVELSCHGSPVLVEQILAECLAAGAVAAEPGEFTYRAVINGRLDMAQAEGIRDLIGAPTPLAARLAAEQVRGALSRRVSGLRERLMDIIGHAEAALEFGEEPDLAGGAPIGGALELIGDEIGRFIAGYRTGRLVREGARVAIAGRPNAGKSSLFNRIVGTERAIVSPRPGTTRDFLTETIDLMGIPVTLADTAGLREPIDEIEAAGVAHARRWLEQADLVVLLVACDAHPDDTDIGLLRRLSGRVLLAASKADLPRAGWVATTPDAVRVSAVTGEGVAGLLSAIAARLSGAERLTGEEILIADARHHEALQRCAARLEAARQALSSGATEEILLEDLRAALHHLGEITGEVPIDAIHERIFSTFCIGK